jgi:hypothetical protein
VRDKRGKKLFLPSLKFSLHSPAATVALPEGKTAKKARGEEKRRSMQSPLWSFFRLWKREIFVYETFPSPLSPSP